MRSSNPAFNAPAFEQVDSYNSAGVMTIAGASTKTMILLGICGATAAVTWKMFEAQNPTLIPLMIGGAIGGLIFALITAFKAEWSPVTGPIYAALEGLFLGGLTAYYNHFLAGIAVQALCLTFGVMFSMLMAYQTGIIKPTEKFKAGICAATGAIMLLYIASFLLSFAGISIPYLHTATPIGMIISVVIVIIAALNLILDFDFIDRGAQYGYPKYMEWYGAFGLMVTLVWLYIEILRLLAIIAMSQE